MSQLRTALDAVARHLADEGHPWALIGGLAVSAYVEPRFTRDIDVAVSVAGDESAEGLVHALQSRGFGVAMVLEQRAHDRLATVRLVPPGESEEGVVVDLMFASSGIESEICREATLLEVFDGLVVPVARLGHMLALKVLARDDERRPQDLVDIRAMLAKLDDVETMRARRSIELIMERGFHRDRDVVRLMEDLLA